MALRTKKEAKIPRREFLKSSAVSVAAMGAISAEAVPQRTAPVTARRAYNAQYSGDRLNRIAFPLGGMGAGMICLEGTGALSHFSLRNRPEVFNEPLTFAALAIKGESKTALVLEGPVPSWKIFGAPGAGNGASGSSFGLPRFASASFQAHFPFATVTLTDHRVNLDVRITGWSPFEPGDADHASLPVAGLEYRFVNRSAKAQEAVFSFNARNFMVVGRNPQAVRATPGGFVLWGGGAADRPQEEGAFSAVVTDPQVKVNAAWFRGGWFDAVTMVWRDIEEAAGYDRPPVTAGDPAPGASLFVPFRLEPGAARTIVLQLSWYVGRTNLRTGKDPAGAAPADAKMAPTYKPWYAGRFADIGEAASYWRDHYDELRQKSMRFSDCFHASNLPTELIEAVAANLTILKSPTVLRQSDGKLWAWEGCSDNAGCCAGSCTHVWNYARAMSSYALLQGIMGARYDAVDRVLHLEPNIKGDFRGFLATATGYGTVGVKGGKPFFDAVAGEVEIREIRYRA